MSILTTWHYEGPDIEEGLVALNGSLRAGLDMNREEHRRNEWNLWMDIDTLGGSGVYL